MNFAILAIIALLGVELAIAGGCALIYSRMRSKADAERAGMVNWGIEVKGAVGTANAAKAAVDLIELQHYKSLRSLFEDQALQLANVKAENVALLKRIEALEVKVASLQRMDRKDRAKDLAPDPWRAPASLGGKEKPEEGSDALDEFLRTNGVPLVNSNGAQPQPATRPGFGAPAH